MMMIPRSTELLLAALLGVASIQPAIAQGSTETMHGIVRAVREAWLSTDLGLPITELPFREGQAFQKGDLLAAFDCAGLEAERKGAEARLRAEEITYENNVRLSDLNATGQFEVRLSKVKVDQAAAELEAYKVKMAQCSLEAPYDGRVAALQAQVHEIPDPTEPLMQIVNTEDLEIDLLLPSVWLRWLRPSTEFSIQIDETGRTMQAEIVRISAVIDPVSQTVKVVGRFTSPVTDVLPGMSGPAMFNVPNG